MRGIWTTICSVYATPVEGSASPLPFPSAAPFRGARLATVVARTLHFSLGMNPGMPVLTTVFSLIRVLIPLVIPSTASSGRAEISKFSPM